MPSAAHTHDGQVLFADQARGLVDTTFMELVTLGGDADDAVASASLDALHKRPLFVNGRGVQSYTFRQDIQDRYPVIP